MANDRNLRPWRAGQSGNPAGRPVGAVSLATRIQRTMRDDSFTAKAVGRQGPTVQYNGEPVEVIIRTAILRAMSGDYQWADWLARNGYGR
jgi:hypothetical protein